MRRGGGDARRRACESAQCGDNADGFDGWLAGFKQEAASAGISRSVIESALADVAYDDDVIATIAAKGRSDRISRNSPRNASPPIGIKKGRTLLLRYAEPFDKIEQRYGVPGPVLVAIWGLETEFGSGSGNFQTFSALATLAYDCRRSDKFHAELIDALKIVQRGDL